MDTIKENSTESRGPVVHRKPDVKFVLVIFLNQVKSVKNPLGLKSVTFQRSSLGAEVFNMSKPAGSTSGCLDILNVKSSEYRLSLLLRYV